MGPYTVKKWMCSIGETSEILDIEFVDPWTPLWETQILRDDLKLMMSILGHEIGKNLIC